MTRIITALLALLFATAANAQIVNSLPYNLTNGTTADATQVMSNFNQIVNSANANAAKNGVNSDITALTALVTPLSASAGGSTSFYGTVAGTANAITIASPVPSGFTLTQGYRAFFKAAATNTGAATLSVNGTTATAIQRRTQGGPIALTGGEIVSGNTYEAYYDGTVWQLLNGGQQLLGTAVSVASASTADLGAAASHNITLTGTTTINAFGSTASVNEPIYFLRFTGAMQLTYNATSLILPGAANITTAAGDTAIALYLGSGNWQIIAYTRASGAPLVISTSGKVAQIVISSTGAVATGTTTTPSDDTIPQNTEGNQYMSVTITPQSASSTLMVDCLGSFATDAGAANFTVALFRDSTANAVAAQMSRFINLNVPQPFPLSYVTTSGSTSSTTFSFRAGLAAAGTTTFNGASGARLLGGAMYSYCKVVEVLP